MYESPNKVFIGFDPLEADAYAVATYSAKTMGRVAPRGLDLLELNSRGLYTRPYDRHNGQLVDRISQAPMSTEFALTRFLVPELCAWQGWAVFMDGDVLVNRDLQELFDLADPTKAVQVVKHNHVPTSATKMDGQIQTAYPRKNWSSVMLINCGHPSNKRLTPQLVNTARGLDLHQFCWLEDDEIGELPPEWNWLVGHSADLGRTPGVIHFTDGVPSMPGHENAPYSTLWRATLREWAKDGGL